ncbi:MAG: DUF3857 domain-containing protein [Bacteroidia bacterium]|nr:DUF3857 domain-containing protein [Bacteroidia bacterium]
MKISIFRIIFSIIAISCSASFAFGQSENAREFGKISVEDIQSGSDDWAEGTQAVILFDYGAVSFELISRAPRIKYTFHRRIKILNTHNQANLSRVVVSYLSPIRGETLSEIKAATYNLNAIGEVVSFKINPRKIHEVRKGKDSMEVVLNFPFVKPGSVIEFSYEIISRNFAQLKPWIFQGNLPVVHSEYHTYIPDGYKYVRLLQGAEGEISHYTSRFQQQAINTSDLFTRNMQYTFRDFGNRFYANFAGSHDMYMMINLPAIVAESFTPETKDYLPGIRLELAEDFLSRSVKNAVFDNWQELAEFVVKKSKIRNKTDRAEIQHISRNATDTHTWQRDRARAIYEYVRKEYSWDKTYSTETWNISQTLNRKSGSSSEINLLLLYLLQDAGFEVWPVMIRTRDQGLLQTIYPAMSQFNHLIVAVILEDKEILLDAVGESEVFGILPKNDLNELGYLVDEEGGKWVKLRDQNKIVRTTYSRFDLDKNGSQLSGDISVINENYSAVLERDRLSQFQDRQEEYLRDFVLIGMKNPQIISDEVKNAEKTDEEPLIINCEVATGDFIRAVDDLVFLKPMMVKMVSENPFVEKNRLTPVDFTYPLRDSHMLGLRIPEGYEVAQLPQPIRVILPNNGGSFTYNVLEMGKILHLTSTILLNKTTFQPSEYEAIRTFFEYVVAKHQEDVILRKIYVQP